MLYLWKFRLNRWKCYAFEVFWKKILYLVNKFIRYPVLDSNYCLTSYKEILIYYLNFFLISSNIIVLLNLIKKKKKKQSNKSIQMIKWNDKYKWIS